MTELGGKIKFVLAVKSRKIKPSVVSRSPKRPSRIRSPLSMLVGRAANPRSISSEPSNWMNRSPLGDLGYFDMANLTEDGHSNEFFGTRTLHEHRLSPVSAAGGSSIPEMIEL